MLSRGTAKQDSALALGADAFVNSKDEDALKGVASSFDMLIDTIRCALCDKFKPLLRSYLSYLSHA